MVSDGRVVVIGGGGHAKVVVSVLRKLRFSVVGYTDPDDRGAILGAPHLGDDQVLNGLIETDPGCAAVIGVGKVDASSARMRLLADATASGFNLPVIVSPRSVVNEDVFLGRGSLVCDGAVTNSGTVTGAVCILNTNSTVEHDCTLGENVHIAPGATLSGGVTVGDHCMIGAGATVVQDVTIGDRCLIGAGSTVLADITIPGVYAGNPVRKIA